MPPIVQMKSCKKIHLSVVVDIVDIVDNNITLESGNLWLMIVNITLEYYLRLTTAHCLNWQGISFNVEGELYLCSRQLSRLGN